MRLKKPGVRETAEDLFLRVSTAIVEPEKSQRAKWKKRFFDLMAGKYFLPNSPTLMNAGISGGQLSACFVLPIEDDLSSIFESLKNAALIHQSGGGTGFSFSSLRELGSDVHGKSDVATGPVGFLKIFDLATETIKQGGLRRGANMAVLEVNHPDILKFIDLKNNFKEVNNFNLSVGITDDFMKALKQNENFLLKSPQKGNKQHKKNMSAAFVFEAIAKAAWTCGDPGLVFLDRINQFNPTPSFGPMKATNPCGEQPLLDYESCNLGSLNLGKYCETGKMQWQLFKEHIHYAVRFLDNVIECNHYPLKETESITLNNRKIGLGIMGLADALLYQGIRYGSFDSFRFTEKVFSVLSAEARAASAVLAEERGPFKHFNKSLWKQLGYKKLRNATVTTVAPTGSISLIADASSGIEPFYSGVQVRNILDGQRFEFFQPSIERMLLASGKIERGQKIRCTEKDLEQWLGGAYVCASDVSIEQHIEMQSIAQRFSDSAVSKTINLSESATLEDVKRAYLLAYEKGCKGITVFRNLSRPTQVIEKPQFYCIDCG